MELPKVIKLIGADNVRDLGGYYTDIGKVIVSNKIFRSSVLSNITQQDISILIGSGLCRIIDLRAVDEMNQNPDKYIKGIDYIHLPIFTDKRISVIDKNFFDNYSGNVKMISDFLDGQEERMNKVYQDFVTEKGTLESIRKFFELLLEKDNGLTIFHCTAGKDRTGMMTALLLRALGATSDTILYDYLFSNKFCERMTKAIKNLKKMGVNDDVINRNKRAFMAQPSYLNITFRTIDDVYGNYSEFLKEGLLVSNSQITDLKKMYLH